MTSQKLIKWIITVVLIIFLTVVVLSYFFNDFEDINTPTIHNGYPF